MNLFQHSTVTSLEILAKKIFTIRNNFGRNIQHQILKKKKKNPANKSLQKEIISVEIFNNNKFDSSCKQILTIRNNFGTKIQH